MRAKVEAIESGAGYTDKQRRVTLHFEGARFAQDRLTVPESMLGLREVALDMELDVEVELATGLARDDRSPEEISQDRQFNARGRL